VLLRSRPAEILLVLNLITTLLLHSPIMATRPKIFSRPGVNGPKLLSAGPTPAMSLGIKVATVVNATTAPKPKSDPVRAFSTANMVGR